MCNKKRFFESPTSNCIAGKKLQRDFSSSIKLKLIFVVSKVIIVGKRLIGDEWKNRAYWNTGAVYTKKEKKMIMMNNNGRSHSPPGIDQHEHRRAAREDWTGQFGEQQP